MIRRAALLLLLALSPLFLATESPAAQDGFILPATPLPEARGFHGSAVLGGYLYIFGGTVDSDGPKGTAPERPTGSVIKAPILPNGDLGKWEPTLPLPQPRHYIGNSTLVISDMVYILGGAAGPLSETLYSTALYTRPLSDGTLLPWQESEPFGKGGLTTVTAVSTPGHVHVIGGKGTDLPVAEVWSNAIRPDGSMGSWFPGPSLPFPLWFHSAGTVGGRVYVWGGLLTGGTSKKSSQMLSAPILGSGQLGPWRRERVELTTSFFRGVASTAGPYLFTISPSYADATDSNDVWYCQIATDGPGQWGKQLTSIPNRIYDATAADYRHGSIFVSGGRVGRGKQMLDSVSILRLSPEAQRLAEKGGTAAQSAQADTVSALTQSTDTSQAPPVTLSYVADAQLKTGAIEGFMTYAAARSDAVKSGKPLVLYFNLEDAAPCKLQNEQLRNAAFTQLLKTNSFAWVDSQDHPQLVQQLGVYRVPTWVFYDKSGNEVTASRRAGVQNAIDLVMLVRQLQ